MREKCEEIKKFEEERKSRRGGHESFGVSLSREFYCFLKERIAESGKYPGFDNLGESHKMDFVMYLAYEKPEALVRLKDED